MIWKKLLVIGILLFLFAVGLGDYLLSVNYKVITLKPYQTTTISQAEVLAKQPISAQSVIGTLVQGSTTYTLYYNSQTLVNNNTKTTTLIILQNNFLLYIDYSLIILSFGIILFSVLGLFYEYLVKKS
ncbi:hypothetical protein SJAV_06360 [Sulfurisphaera javensis]|uniref:Uncharacterized protein n=1 Tax=Sulfurisphaera javensis TaxID=2049879 RepID=A0AAT9GPE1_9CREN